MRPHILVLQHDHMGLCLVIILSAISGLVRSGKFRGEVHFSRRSGKVKESFIIIIIITLFTVGSEIL